MSTLDDFGRLRTFFLQKLSIVQQHSIMFPQLSGMLQFCDFPHVSAKFRQGVLYRKILSKLCNFYMRIWSLTDPFWTSSSPANSAGQRDPQKSFRLFSRRVLTFHVRFAKQNRTNLHPKCQNDGCSHRHGWIDAARKCTRGVSRAP